MTTCRNANIYFRLRKIDEKEYEKAALTNNILASLVVSLILTKQPALKRSLVENYHTQFFKSTSVYF